jgi:hypothetical protein
MVRALSSPLNAPDVVSGDVHCSEPHDRWAHRSSSKHLDALLQNRVGPKTGRLASFLEDRTMALTGGTSFGLGEFYNVPINPLPPSLGPSTEALQGLSGPSISRTMHKTTVEFRRLDLPTEAQRWSVEMRPGPRTCWGPSLS